MCKVFITSLFISFWVSPIWAQDNEIITPLYPELQVYNSWVEKEKEDSPYNRRRNWLLNIDSDTFFQLYVTKEYEEIVDEVFFFHQSVRYKDYADILVIATQIDQAADYYNSSALKLEADFIRAAYLPALNDSIFKHKEDAMYNVIKKAEKSNNLNMKVRMIIELWQHSFYSGRYAKAFYYANILEHELKKSTNINVLLNSSYFRIGQTYHSFRDYDRAIYYFNKALEYPFDTLGENYELKALNYIAYYYMVNEKIDSVEYYNKSILEKPSLSYRRLLEKSVAIVNLGHLAFERGDYDKSIVLLKAGREAILSDNDYGFIARIDIGLGSAYLAKGDYNKAWEMIESARNLGIMHSFDTRSQKLYTLLSKYYIRTGNPELAVIYQDSAILAVQEYEKEYTSLFIAKGEQLIHERDSNLKNEEIRIQEKQIFYSLMIMIIVSLAFFMVLIYYRKTRSAYRALAKKSHEWALSSSGQIKEVSISPETEDVNADEKYVMTLIIKYVVEEEGFRDTDLTLNYLSYKLAINRTYLSKAINKLTGKSFTNWLNEYRIKEAIKRLSDPSMDKLSMDALSYDIGFNNRTTFYRSFKKITGISPSNFKENQEDIINH